jgi:hypothetical protein
MPRRASRRPPPTQPAGIGILITTPQRPPGDRGRSWPRALRANRGDVAPGQKARLPSSLGDYSLATDSNADAEARCNLRAPSLLLSNPAHHCGLFYVILMPSPARVSTTTVPEGNTGSVTSHDLNLCRGSCVPRHAFKSVAARFFMHLAGALSAWS